MHRPDHSTAYPDGIAPGVPGYGPGNPTGLPPVAPTRLVDTAMNDITESLCQLVEGAGITLTKGDYAQVLEAVQFLSKLQSAWEHSETATDDPHIDITGSQFHIGRTGGDRMFEVDEAGDSVSINADFYVPSKEFTLGGGIAKLLISGTGAGSNPKAIVMTNGVAGETNLVAGSWTPTVSAVSGTGVVSGDFTNMAGSYQRNGNVVSYTLAYQVNTTGWGAGGSVSFTLPVTGTVSGYVRGTATLASGSVGTYFTTLSLARSASPTVMQVLMEYFATYTSYVTISGQYVLS